MYMWDKLYGNNNSYFTYSIEFLYHCCEFNLEFIEIELIQLSNTIFYIWKKRDIEHFKLTIMKNIMF